MRRYELSIAWRFLLSGRLQTGLILGGVTVGIIAYAFIASLINGVQAQLIRDVVGNLSHVTLTPMDRAASLIEPPEDAEPLVGVGAPPDRTRRISNWRPLTEAIEEVPGVAAVSPQAVSGGFIQRGGRTRTVSIIGVEPDRVSEIVAIEDNLIRGSAVLGTDDILIGSELASELGLEVGQVISVRSEEGRALNLRIRGIFQLGNFQLDLMLAIVELRTAQALLGLEGDITRIEVQIADVFDAEQLGALLGRLTGLESTTWIDEIPNLRNALQAQGDTGNLVKFFSILTITIAVASVLLVSALRRRSEIGIMRSMGVPQRSILVIFILQGFMIGLIGSIIGAGMGWLFVSILAKATMRLDGTLALPADPALGEYHIAILLATLASSLAAILPARAAARIDPVEVLQT